MLTESGWNAAQAIVSSIGSRLRRGRGPKPTSVGIRSRVVRVELVGGGGFRAAVVKERVDADGVGYDPADYAPGSLSTRVAYEAAALEFLADRLGRRLAPRLICVDYEAGVLVMEDLGEGARLVECLRGDDSGRADDALCRYSAAMGELHAISAGRSAEFGDRLERFGPRPSNPLDHVAHEFVKRFAWAVESAGCRLPAEVRSDLEVAADRIRDPGPFLTLAHGDICPGHDRVVDGQTVFIDWELAGFRHAFYDLAYLYVPFPSCGFAGRLPARARAKAVAAYCETAAPAIPAIANGDQFSAELAQAWTFWVARDVGSLLPGATAVDTQWGTATHRQRVLQLLGSFAASDEVRRQRPAMANWVADAHQALSRRWADTVQMPFYPAYQGSPVGDR